MVVAMHASLVRVCVRDRAGHDGPMGIGTSLFLIAVGAILYFAVDADISGLEITTIGLILMIVGVIGLVISLFFLSSHAPRDDGAHRGPRPRARTSARCLMRARLPLRAGSFDAGPRAGGG